VSPAYGDAHQTFAVSITARRATGIFGDTRRGYTAEARATNPGVACVNARDGVFPEPGRV
jgi:hypothetical protein